MVFRYSLLAGVALLSFQAQAQTADSAAPVADPATGQAQPEPAAEPALEDDEFFEDEAIIVTGGRPRGSVIGDIPPEDVLDSRDVRATGATTINELLDALAPQLGSAQGRGGERPILLLDGRRTSGFREIRDIPTEAISRVEILPEEVALKYGYRADQKVVNIVLRERFRSTAVSVAGQTATEGGYLGGEADVTRLMLNREGRTTINVHAEGNGMLTEDERSIRYDSLPPGTDEDAAGAARSLIGSQRLLRGGVTVNRTIWDDVSATFNAEAEHNEGRSLIGLGELILDPLGRRAISDSGHLGFALNSSNSGWQWSLTGNADLDRRRTRTERDDLIFIADRTRETTASGDLTATANGKLFALPAGDASATVTLAADTVHLESERERQGDTDDSSVGRTSGRAAVNVDLPVSRRNRDFSALGNLTLNFNAEVAQLSDFGTLTKIGAGANFSPAERLNFIGSWSREEGAPSINQLGDAIIETPDARVFDFTTGETVLVTAVTGGNPDLDADRRTVWKLGANWQPFEETDLRLRGEFVSARIDRPIRSIFGPTETLEDAFPERFERDADGRLFRVDLRPINFDEARRDTLRIGFDFSKPLKSRRPSPSVMDQLRAQFRGGAPRRADEAPPAPATPSTSDAPSPPPPPRAEGEGPREGGFGRGPGGGRGGGFFGGGSRGRLTFSLTDTITLRDEVRIGPGIPVLDYLGGEASGAGGGTPRHKVETRAGWSNNGLGARLSANWQSATQVRTRVGDELRFSPVSTFDLRLFANLGEQPELLVKHPWLRGSSLRLEVNNIFDSKPRVRDSAGLVPINYQSDLLDPLGRTVKVTFRKLFSPAPGTWRRERESGAAAGAD